MGEKAIGYCRVSTERQALEGVSLQMQAEKILQYAALNDLEIVETIEEAGISGKSLNRPGLGKALELVESGKAKHLIVFKLDRIGRNTIEVLSLIEKLEKKGAALHSITERLDTKSAIGRFVLRTLASLAEMERDLIGERTRAALQQKKENGEKTGGNVPFGFSVKQGEDVKVLQPNAGEQEVISRIHRLHLEGKTFREIARRLNERGYLTKTGKAWTHVQIARICKAAA